MEPGYDAIVIGAGPAGSTFAREAAKENLSVLLIEKRTEIGVPKRCGEGLSEKALKRVGLKPDPVWLAQKIKGAVIHSPDGNSVKADYKSYVGYTIERKVFDKWLALKAADAGAEVLAGTRALSLIKHNKKIVGVKIQNIEGTFEVSAKIIVAADGVESKVARWAGINTTNKLSEICSAVQFEMANIKLENPNFLELYLGNKIAPGGYVWVFPKGSTRANIGIGIRANKKGKAIDYLQKFVHSKDDLKKGSIIEVNGGGVPVGEPIKELVADNFMIIGDAAHQVNAIHGGGVGEAMLAAKIAAEVAAKAIKKDTTEKKTLVKYKQLWFNTEGNRLSKLVNLREIIENLTDDELNFLAKELSGEDVVNLTKGKQFSLLAKIFAKNPRLIRFMPKLLSAR